jgi:hypothetical protein
MRRTKCSDFFFASQQASKSNPGLLFFLRAETALDLYRVNSEVINPKPFASELGRLFRRYVHLRLIFAPLGGYLIFKIPTYNQARSKGTPDPTYFPATAEVWPKITSGWPTTVRSPLLVAREKVEIVPAPRFATYA